MHERPPALSELKNRDAEALNRWVKHFYPPLFRFLRHLTRDRDVAEDLVQQTFLKALKGLNGFEERSTMNTWMHSIAFREYVAWRRRRRILFPLSVLEGQPDRQIDRVEQGEALLQGLHRLPSSLREAFLMFEVQGLTVAEIARVTGVPEGTVKSRLHHARERLKAMLTGSLQEVPCGH